MEDFRSQLGQVLDTMIAGGQTPLFLVCDLDGAEQMKKTHGEESLEKFHQAAIAAVVSATNGADAFTYGETRLVAILVAEDYDRLKTFALIQKLRRAIPMLGQSFDAFLQPDFDVIEYDTETAISGVMAQLAQRRRREETQAA